MISNTTNPARGAAAGVVRMAASTLLWGALLFLTAGTARWVWGWIYLALIVLVLSVYSWILLALHPDLIEERAHPPADAKAWDKPLVAVVGMIGPLLVLLLCGVDRRFGWSPASPAAVHLAGLALVAAGGAFTAWAVAHNRFFSAVVRIQRDRGHQVVDSGPYRLVRHPGYAGSILHSLGTCPALGSWWALAIAVPLCLTIAARTGLEDRTLRAELDGYADYARRTRYRLVPGIW